jgi:protein with PEP-CTERM/exosortase system signal
MKNKLIIMAGAVALLASFSTSVQAIPITGGIAISGSYTANGTAGDLTTATSMAVSGPYFIGATSGSFVGATLPVTFATPISVNSPLNLVGVQLWSVLVGSATYTFTVSSETQTIDSPNQVTLVGAGTFADGTLADSSVGTFQLGFGVTQTTFSFQNNNQVNVPDGGMTVMLLGGALAGLGLLKKKFLA